jgi:putative alpha-1,2-mannosidase
MITTDRGHCLACALIAVMGMPPSVGAVDNKPSTPAGWVNTFIGTGGGGGADYGGTMPFVTTPFGMINWTAQTRQNRISVSSYARSNYRTSRGTLSFDSSSPLRPRWCTRGC